MKFLITFLFFLALTINLSLVYAASGAGTSNTGSSLYKSGKKLIIKAKKLEKKEKIEKAKTLYLKALVKLRDEGVVKAIGCGMNQNEMLIDFAKEGCFDVFLLAGRYTLIDQTSLDQLIPICEKNQISLVLGGVFNSGILIDPSPNTYFDYSKLDKDWVKNVSESLFKKKHNLKLGKIDDLISYRLNREKLVKFKKSAIIECPAQ